MGLAQCRLTGSTGSVVARVGDRFREESVQWEIVAFAGTFSYSPGSLGGARDVNCRPLSPLPTWWTQWVEDDGTVTWNGDSVAVRLQATFQAASMERLRAFQGSLRRRSAANFPL